MCCVSWFSMAEEQNQKLRDVFSLFDCDQRGCITVERFCEVAREHFSAAFVDESFSSIMKILDPEEKGEINFSQFCEGVKQIIELKGDTRAQVEITRYVLFCFTAAANKIENIPTVPNPNKLCMECDAVVADDIGDATAVSFSKSLPLSLSCDLVKSYDLDTGISSDDGNRLHHLGTFDRGDCMSVDCPADHMFEFSQCEVKASVSDSLQVLSVNSRRMKSSSVTSHLHHGASFQVLSASGRSSASNVVLEDIDDNFLELNGKVKLLQEQFCLLTENQRQNHDRQTRIEDENVHMIDRVRILEDQLREVEIRSLEKLREEQKKSRELLIRLDKDKSSKVDILMQSYNEIERECSALKEDVPKLRLENERLCKENSLRKGLIDDLRQQISELSLECENVRQTSSEEHSRMSRETYVQAQLLEELGKELDELRSFKSLWIGQSLDEFGISQYKELEECVASLKQENTRLRDQIDDLHSTLLHQQVYSQSHDMDSSTLNNMSRGEMIDAIKREHESNQVLRNYVEHITLRILEKNPTILEVISRSK